MLSERFQQGECVVPNRILRDGILSSERVASLGWPAEVFYRRLMSVVDDFGRYYATPMLLRAACYPLHLDKVSDADVGKWLEATQKAGLVSVYPASDGKRYLQMADFRQQMRAKDSRYPADAKQMLSTCSADATHLLANAHLDVDVDVDVCVGDKGAAAVIDAYHRLLPGCQQVSVINDKRKKRIAGAVKLAKRVCAEQGWPYDPAEFWSAYFSECASDAWMRGEVPNPKNPTWRQNLDVLLAEDRFAGVMDRAIASMRGAA